MSIESLNPRDRRALVAGAAGLALLLVATRGLPAAVRWNEAAIERAAVVRERADRAGAYVASASRTEAHVVALQQSRNGVEELLLEGSTPSGAGAALAEQLAAASEDAEVELGTVEVRTAQQDASPIGRVAVRTTVSGDAAAVAYFLASLEVGPTLLRIRELVVSAQATHGFPTEQAGITAEIVIDGLHRRQRGDRP